MTTATRLDTDLNHWMPKAKHYAVDGGFLVVVAADFLSAEGTEVFYADDRGGALSMEAIKRFPHGTSHDEALIQLGYLNVVDTVVDPEPIVDVPVPALEVIRESVESMLPPEMLAVIAPHIVQEEP